jgi:23S rRNA (uracil1939-C5)-methyltransferase
MTKIIKLDNQGRGITYLNNKIVFVPYTLINEEVEIEIIKEHANYMEGKLVKIITPSSKRIKPLCPYYEECGGCSFEHLNYNYYLETKKNLLANIFKKHLNLDLDIEVIKNHQPYNYRNKISLKVINGNYGYYESQTNNLIAIKECLIVDENVNNFLKVIPLINLKNGYITIRVNTQKELLVIIDTKDKLDFNKVRNDYNIKGIIVNDKLVYGQDYFIETINNYKFKINYNSFFQTNNYVNSELLKILDDNVPNNLNVLDLFCGVGSLGLSVANKSKTVTGIEIIPEAILNAKENAKLNSLGNTNFLCTDALKAPLNKYPSIDLTIVDPPRSGLNNKIIDSLNSQYLIYISCDPITLVRDLRLLTKYQIIKLYMLDMFSYTGHMETFVKLEKKHCL